VSQQDVNTSLTIHIVPASREALVRTYQPVLNDLASSDAHQKFLAIQAVTDYPQSFLQDVVLKMSENPQTANAAISGLKKWPEEIEYGTNEKEAGGAGRFG
jgi:hypothetical protein